MSEGISKERFPQLMGKISDLTDAKGTIFYDDLENILLGFIEELDPWLPIDEHTPEDTQLLVKFDDGTYEVAKLLDYRGEKGWIDNDGLDFDYGFEIPTHYKTIIS